MHNNETNKQHVSAWKLPLDIEKNIREMSIPELKQACDQAFSIDPDAAYLAIMRCRIFASRLRHEQDYESAKTYYRRIQRP